MPAEDLIREAERIARPSLLLSEAASPHGAVAWWGGAAAGAARGRPDDTLRISIDVSWLAARGYALRGVLRVSDVALRWNWRTPVHVEQDPAAALAPVAGAVPLTGREAASLPPFEALCLYGGAPVESWLLSAGLERTDYDRAAMLPEAGAYQEHYQRHSPLHSSGIVAVLGGWHAMWPDDDYYLPREMRLVLWTLRDAEPWIEVFQRGANLIPRVRAT